MREKLGGWDHTTMSDFESRLPRHQLDFRAPHRANQHSMFLRAGEAHAATEAEQPRINNDGAGLLQDLSAKSLLPGLITLRDGPRASPIARRRR